MAESPPNARAILTDGAEDVEVGLAGSQDKLVHLLGDLEARVGGDFNLPVPRVESHVVGERDLGKVVKEELLD